MSDQMQRQRRGCGGHPALRAKCDAPVTSISKLKSFEKPKPCKRKQRTCLVRSRLRCRPRKARCRRGLGSSRKRRAPCWRQAGLGPPAPPAASRGSPGTFLTARSWGQRGHARPAGDPRGDRAGHPSLRTNLGNRRGSTGASGPGTGLRQADPRPREACRNASHACRTPRRLTPRATPPPAPGRDGGGTRAPFLHPVGTRPGASVRTPRARPPTRSCRGRGGSHAGRGRVRPWHLCLPRLDPSEDTNKRRGHDGQDGPCGDRLLGVLQVPGPVRARHDACSRGQSWHIPCKPGKHRPAGHGPSEAEPGWRRPGPRPRCAGEARAGEGRVSTGPGLTREGPGQTHCSDGLHFSQATWRLGLLLFRTGAG